MKIKNMPALLFAALLLAAADISGVPRISGVTRGVKTSSAFSFKKLLGYPRKSISKYVTPTFKSIKTRTAAVKKHALPYINPFSVSMAGLTALGGYSLWKLLIPETIVEVFVDPTRSAVLFKDLSDSEATAVLHSSTELQPRDGNELMIPVIFSSADPRTGELPYFGSGNKQGVQRAGWGQKLEELSARKGVRSEQEALRLFNEEESKKDNFRKLSWGAWFASKLGLARTGHTLRKSDDWHIKVPLALVPQDSRGTVRVARYIPRRTAETLGWGVSLNAKFGTRQGSGIQVKLRSNQEGFKNFQEGSFRQACNTSVNKYQKSLQAKAPARQPAPTTSNTPAPQQQTSEQPTAATNSTPASANKDQVKAIEEPNWLRLIP